MSGLGNDFVIFDERQSPLNLIPSQIVKISDRKNIGCDQLIIIKNPQNSAADCYMEIYNPDGSKSGACGNATRCVAAILMKEKNRNSVIIETAAGLLSSWKSADLISVDMGKPRFSWSEIPLQSQVNPDNLEFFGHKFSCVNIGNPHAVTFLKEKISDQEFYKIGPQVETNSIFPQKTNVEFVRIISDDLLEVRVWERGAGETLACGSGACAVAIIAIKNQLVKSKKLTIRFPGGDLLIEWNGEGSSVIMTGNYNHIFNGLINSEFLS
jgi:diaminopimelate epimerase